MTTLITLNIPVGGDAGPFNLYSNTDGYTVPFATGISAAALTAGYTSTVVPEGTTIIRVLSTGQCTNYIDITINLITTTTTTSSSSTTSTTTTAVPTTTTTSSSSTSTTTSTTTEFIPNLNSGSSGVQANPATEGCNPLDFPYTPATFPFPPSLVAIRVTNLSVTWSDIEYVEIVSVTDDPNMVITYDGNVVAPAMQFIPATDSTWQYPLSMTIDAFSCINTSETWEIRVKLTGYPISNIADAIINFLTNPFCPDCTSTTTSTTTATPTTTTTTTTGIALAYGFISNTSNITDACSEPLNTSCWISNVGGPSGNETITGISVIYLDAGGTTPFIGDGQLYHIAINSSSSSTSCEIDGTGSVTSPISICP